MDRGARIEREEAEMEQGRVEQGDDGWTGGAGTTDGAG